MSAITIQSGLSVPPENYTTKTDGASSQQSFLQQLIQEIEQIIEEISQMQGGSSPSTSPSPLSGGDDPVSPAAGRVLTMSGGTNPTSPADSTNPTSAAASGNSTLGPGFPPQLEPYRQDIENASEQTGVPANLLAAQILQESGGNPNATSTNVNGLTDQGLLQVDPATFASLQQQYPQLQGQNLSNPATNILAAAYYMKDLGQQFGGNWSEALRGYNSGPSQVDPSNLSNCTDGDPNYVNSVLNYESMIESGGQSS